MKSGPKLCVRLGAALAFCLAMAAAVAPSAIAQDRASTPSPSAASNGAARLSFTTQAETAGLTADQARMLQGEVDRYLATLGGTQVSPNKIDLNGRGEAFISLPGENHPRNFTPMLDTQSEVCPYGAFCAYSGEGLTGSQINMTFCSSYALPGWGNEPGSWDNNQTPGTSARMIDNSGRVIDNSGPAHNMNYHYDWNPVWWVDPC